MIYIVHILNESRDICNVYQTKGVCYVYMHVESGSVLSVGKFCWLFMDDVQGSLSHTMTCFRTGICLTICTDPAQYVFFVNINRTYIDI